MRGGQPARIVLMTLEAQFSPHVRGSTHETDTVNSDGMIHPACAGVTLISVVGKAKILNSPRMRGGQPLFIDWPFDGVSIHPACAGVNPCGYTGVGPNGDSPRTRGGQPFARVALRASLFTPHARGSTPMTRAASRTRRIHPARAGVNLTCRCSGCMMMHSPRMRGGQPYN